jgi:hypothetical protein
MEPEASLSCSKVPATGPCPEPDKHNNNKHYFSKINFNIYVNTADPTSFQPTYSLVAVSWLQNSKPFSLWKGLGL